MSRSLVLVDDHPITLDGLRAAFQQSNWIVHKAVTSVDEAYLAILQYRPKFVITDLAIAERSGFELYQLTRTSVGDGPAFIAYSGHSELRETVRHSGFSGFISKAANAEQVVKCVEMVAQGKMWVTESTDEDDEKIVVIGPTLTVLKLISQGMTTKEIAHILHLSISGVDYHLQKLQHLFGVQTRSEIIFKATKLGIL